MKNLVSIHQGKIWLEPEQNLELSARRCCLFCRATRSDWGFCEEIVGCADLASVRCCWLSENIGFYADIFVFGRQIFRATFLFGASFFEGFSRLGRCAPGVKSAQRSCLIRARLRARAIIRATARRNNMFSNNGTAQITCFGAAFLDSEKRKRRIS